MLTDDNTSYSDYKKAFRFICQFMGLPKDKVIGLSKMGRIAEMCAKRLQLQEKIGEDINEVMRLVLGTDDVAVIIEGKHGCMTARGVKSREALTRTACLRGAFNTNSNLRSELYSLIKKNI